MSPATIDGKAGLRIVTVLALLIAVLTVGGRHYVEAFLPLYRTTIDIAHPDYHVRMMEIDPKDGALIVVELGRRTVMRDQSGKLRHALVIKRASTQMGYVLIHPFILFGVALVWPSLGLRCRLERLAISLPLLLVVEMLDMPIVLAGAIEDASAYTGRFGAGIDWVRVMDGGGRYALCIAAAGIAISIHAVWLNYRNKRIDPAGIIPGTRPG
jgi:hypothetical protein